MNNETLENLTLAVKERFAGQLKRCETALSELTIEVAAADYLSVCTALRDEQELKFEQLSDLCGVDYLSYGEDEWSTQAVSTSGFSRGVDVGESSTGRMMFGDEQKDDKGRLRYAAVIHLLSYTHNQRIRVRCYADNNEMPVIASVTSLWSGADWYEREAFDLFGILFTGHDDLRRLLCDYGFVGHAFRKDFPMVGNVEMRYDPEQQRVVYQPVSIKPRVLVPRVIRDDHRYLKPQQSEPGDA